MPSQKTFFPLSYQTLVTAASSDKTLAEAVSADRVTLRATWHRSSVITAASWRNKTEMDTDEAFLGLEHKLQQKHSTTFIVFAYKK